MEEIYHKMLREMLTQVDNVIIEGLKRKGFTFLTRRDLNYFIELRCTCEDFPHKKLKVFLVDDEPFLHHWYESDAQVKQDEFGETYVTLTHGSYKYP